MRLNSIEKFLVFRRRAGVKRNVEFHAQFYKIKTGKMPVPERYRAMDLGRVTLGEIAFILRYRAGYTTRELAKELDVSHQTITNWEYDRKGEVSRQIIYLKSKLFPVEKEFLRDSYGIKLR